MYLSRKTVIVSLLLGALLIPAICSAGWVDHSSPNVVAVHAAAVPTGDTGYGGWMLFADGTVWSYYVDHGYTQYSPEYEPPVPVDQIRFWSFASFVTMDGHVWTHYLQSSEAHEWQDLGPVPVGPVSTMQQDLGSLKFRFGPKPSSDQ